MRIESGRMFNDYIQPDRNQYCIPVFQRDYAWTAEQCEKLFEDIVIAAEKDRLHFCGSFVYAPLGRYNHINTFIIIDGQQRFTTLYILIKALADSATDEQDKYSLEHYLYNNDGHGRFQFEEKYKLKLKPIKSDNDQLQLLMAGKLDEMDKSKNGIIYHNYMLFREKIAAYLAGNPANSVMTIQDGIDNLICADICLDQEDDAQEIFERINSTGITLGLPDLIRNFVLMTEKDQERLYLDYWLRIQNLLTQDSMEAFFTDYINMKIEGFTTAADAYRDFKRIFRDGKYTNESMLKEIKHYAELYHVFLHGDNALSAEVNAALEGLRRLNQSTIYLFLFHVFDDYQNENHQLSMDELARVLRLLLNYSIRRMVCEIGSASLRGFYKSLYSRVFSDPNRKTYYYDALVSFLCQLTSHDGMPTDEEFVISLRERNLYRKNALCKYLLTTIENRGKEKLLLDNLSIEHIMPQNKNMSTEWQRMLGDNWQEVKDRYLHTLGNLTLTGYNSELGDLPFQEKREKLHNSVTHITELDRDVDDKTVWNAETIENRAKRLSQILLDIYRVEQPKIKVVFTDSRYREYTVADPNDATYKDVSYYVLLGEHVNVDSFASMMCSVARKMYEIDPNIIEHMAANLEMFPTWASPVFSYDEKTFRKYRPLKDGSNIFICTGFSAVNCIYFIRALLKKYNINPEEQFVYGARPSSAAPESLKWRDTAKTWCVEQQDKGLLGFNAVNSEGRYVRFTTPLLDRIIPRSPNQFTPWNTSNFYFYEITKVDGKIFIQLYFYCLKLSEEMKNAFLHLSEITNRGALNRGYKLYFKTSEYDLPDNAGKESISNCLCSMWKEIEAFEADVAARW